MAKSDWQYRANCLMPEGLKLPPGIFRYGAAVEYDGSDYCGWQRQRHCTSVQGTVENALSIVANEPVVVACAGRTDAGVHGTNQIIHFDSRAIRSPRNWIRGCNANLPGSVRLHWAGQVSDDFHARFRARSRTYRYVVLNSPLQPALMRHNLAWERKPLSVPAMKQAAAALCGKHDFTSFRAAGCQSKTAWREMRYIDIFKVNEMVVFEFCATAFLLHMVRNIVGSLLTVGLEERGPEWIARLLDMKDRSKASKTAAAAGLYLVAIEYPSRFDMPGFEPGPHFVGRGPGERPVLAE